ncbi:MAG: WYL domain-containing protein, partial [Chloroflexi bacterium]|nr:WYL domain-containing protein [Chloroflexota bacterium]
GDHGDGVALVLALVRRAQRQRAALCIRYRAAGGALTLRTVAPLAIEQHGSERLLRAYCLHARDERSFRLDRIAGAQLVPRRVARGRPRRLEPVRARTRAATLQPRRGIWLEP